MKPARLNYVFKTTNGDKFIIEANVSLHTACTIAERMHPGARHIGLKTEW